MIPNGLLLCAGGTDPLKAGVEGAALSDSIKLITHSPYSHAMMAIDGNCYESTESKDATGKTISGPQISDPEARVAQYQQEGGHVDLYQFLPQFEPDWQAAKLGALHMVDLRIAGELPYNVKRLLGDAVERSVLFDLFCLPADGILEYLAAHSLGVVCSEMAAFVMQYGGVPEKLARSGIVWLPETHSQPIGDSPEDLAEMPIWKPISRVA